MRRTKRKLWLYLKGDRHITHIFPIRGTLGNAFISHALLNHQKFPVPYDIRSATDLLKNNVHLGYKEYAIYPLRCTAIIKEEGAYKDGCEIVFDQLNRELTYLGSSRKNIISSPEKDTYLVDMHLPLGVNELFGYEVIENAIAIDAPSEKGSIIKVGTGKYKFLNEVSRYEYTTRGDSVLLEGEDIFLTHEDER